MCIEDKRSKFSHHLVYVANGEVIIALQSVVLLLSLVAAYTYALSAWRNGDKHLSVASLTKATPYSFHIAHLIFCFFFVFQNGVDMALYKTKSQICFCDPFNILFTVVYSALMLMNCIFIRYWKRCFGAENRTASYVRLSLYMSLVLVHSIAFLSAVFAEPCQSFNGINYRLAISFWVTSFLVVAIDHAILAGFCVHRYHNMKTYQCCSLDSAELQLSLFLLNPISLFIGVISYMALGCQGCTIIRSILGPVCLIVVPTSLQLWIMWKRDSIVENDVFESNPSFRFNMTLRATQTALDAVRGSELVELEKGSSFFDLQQSAINEEADSGGLLKRVVKEMSEKLLINIPLKSRFVFIRTMVSGDSQELRDDIGCLIIEEHLSSSPSLVIASKMYITSVVLPVLERAVEIRSDRMETLLSSAKPTGNGSSLNLADVESSRIFRELEKQYKDSSAHSEKVFMLMSCVQKGLSAAGASHKKRRKLLRTEVLGWTGEAMGALHSGEAVFKPSKEKKAPAVAIIPTNCQVHVTTLGLSNPTEFPTTPFVSLTFGAPAAHALGFKNGGLRNMKSRIAAFNFAKSSLAMQHDIIQLEFDTRVRECIVVGQALGSSLSACMDMLARVISQKKGASIRQYAKIGILLHSVSLLTTSGNEEAMLDDFAGAYDMLNLSISLEPPPVVTDRFSFYNASKVNQRSFVADEHEDGTTIRLSVVGVAPQRGGVGNIKVQLQVEPLSAYHWVRKALRLSNTEQPVPDISVFPVLFNLGVNEMQSVANVAGSTSIQSDINDHGVSKLKHYYHQYAEFLASGDGTNKKLDDLPELLLELEELIEAEKKGRGKLVSLLLTSCYIARGLNGIRTTSCKSAKDRTSVFHTLEIVRIAHRNQLIDGSVEQMALDELRGIKGVRLRNCRDNVGRAKYAFNQLQLKVY